MGKLYQQKISARASFRSQLTHPVKTVSKARQSTQANKKRVFTAVIKAVKMLEKRGTLIMSKGTNLLKKMKDYIAYYCNTSWLFNPELKAIEEPEVVMKSQNGLSKPAYTDTTERTEDYNVHNYTYSYFNRELSVPQGDDGIRMYFNFPAARRGVGDLHNVRIAKRCDIVTSTPKAARNRRNLNISISAIGNI